MTDISNELLMGTGYQENKFESWLMQQRVPYTGSPCTSYGYETVTTATWVPPQPGLPAIPAVPPSLPEFRQSVSAGWSSSARSISPIAQNNYVEYSAQSGAYGVFLGLGPKGADGLSINLFTYGLMVDTLGVNVLENGTIVKQLKSACPSSAKLRIIRQPTNVIAYMVVYGSQSLFYVSTKPAQLVDLYGYGRLYSIGDLIDGAAISTGELQFGRA